MVTGLITNNPGPPVDRKPYLGNAMYTRSDSYKNVEIQQPKIESAFCDFSTVNNNEKLNQPHGLKPHMGNAVCIMSDSCNTNLDSVNIDVTKINSFREMYNLHIDSNVLEEFIILMDDRFRGMTNKEVNQYVFYHNKMVAKLISDFGCDLYTSGVFLDNIDEIVLNSLIRLCQCDSVSEIVNYSMVFYNNNNLDNNVGKGNKIKNDGNKLLIKKQFKNCYIFYNKNKNLVESLEKNDWARRDSAVFIYKNFKIKYVGCNKKQCKEFFVKNNICNEYMCQAKPERGKGVLDTISDVSSYVIRMCEGLTFVMDTLVMLGTTKERIESITGLGDLVKHLPLILSLLRFAHSSISMIVKGFSSMSWSDFIEPIFDLVALLVNGADYVFQSKTILASALALILPKSVFKCLQQMYLLSSKKILDDDKLILELYSTLDTIFDYFKSIFPSFVLKNFSFLFDMLNFKEAIIAVKLKNVYDEWDKNKRVMLDLEYREKVKSLNEELLTLKVRETLDSAKSYKIILQNHLRLMKSISAYELSSRVEPCCFVFEGPPGTHKSVFVNKLIQVLGKTNYCHKVGNVTDGKDFYDSYNNEEVFFMDDVGQQGKSQWRNLINWVSSVKFPLDCASVDLKDTKYFNSELILLTTNRFINMGGLLQTDCIDNIQALHRRGYVFDFKHVHFENGQYYGTIYFKRYNLQTQQFEESFPSDMVDLLNEKEVDIKTRYEFGTSGDALTWMSTIVLGLNQVKKRNYVSNVLSDKEVLNIRINNPFYECQFFDRTVRNIITFKDMIQDQIQIMVGKVMSFVHQILLCINDKKKIVALVCAVSVGVCLIYLLYRASRYTAQANNKDYSSDSVSLLEYVDSKILIENKAVHPTLDQVSKQVFEIDTINMKTGKPFEGCCIISERFVILPRHALLNQKQLSIIIYKDRRTNNRMIDMSVVPVVFEDKINDVAILKLSDGWSTPLTKLANRFMPNNIEPIIAMAVCGRLLKIEGLVDKTTSVPRYYSVPDGLQTNDAQLHYNLSKRGLCGAPLLSRSGHILGFHVAGKEIGQKGFSVMFSTQCLENIYSILQAEDKGLKIKTPLSYKNYLDTSGVKIDAGINVFNSAKSKIVKSPMFNVFPNTRAPAELQISGNHTVKDIAKMARSCGSFIPLEEIEFAKKLLRLYLKPFGDLCEKEIILGNDLLARFNKDSSNGFFDLKTKQECFDYENGTFTEDFRKRYIEFERKIESGNIEPTDILWIESLKDELKNQEKLVPRSFRISPVTVQVATKKCFGKMVEHLEHNMWKNLIMIGINPFKDWPKLYNKFANGRQWAGDVSKYDKNMKIQIQDAISDVILEFYKGKHPILASNLLRNIGYSIVQTNDDTHILTHSLSSGCYLTSLFNSLVNRSYTAMWYYRNLKQHGFNPNVDKFHMDIVDPVYGDDRVNSLLNPAYEKILNAETMRDYFESLGMIFTDSMKNPIDSPFMPIEKITFLKRSFVYHGLIGDIVGPLDKRTIYSSLSWIMLSNKCDTQQILMDKIHSFQREIFLHEDTYEADMETLRSSTDMLGIQFHELDVEYLLSLYKENYDPFYRSKFGVFI